MNASTVFVLATLFKEGAWSPTFPLTKHPKRNKARHGKFVVSVGNANTGTSVYPARGLLTTRQDSTRLMPEGVGGRKCRKLRARKR